MNTHSNDDMLMDYETLKPKEAIDRAMTSLEERGFLPELVASGAEALARIKALIPPGASVMNGSSRTLEQIGFVDLLKEGKHGWNNLHDAVLAEQDPAKKATLRKQAVVSDFYLGSAHAVAETGEMVIASNSGSQLPHLVFTSPNLILVVSAKKIEPTLAAAIDRLERHVLPLEDERMKAAGGKGSAISKLLILKKEPPFMGRKFHVIFVRESLGF